ncbi:MAG: MFS transporter [Candidatus Lokiarchaeota archaeon]|nr:MFS transporter [Candidatus Lokiarchaeota archaeon]
MSEKSQYQVSSYRWIILVLFMLVGMTTQILWITFAPITTESSAIFTAGDTDLILILSLVFMIAYLPVNFPASWCIDKFGLKWGTGVGVIITGVFGFLRIFSVDYTWLLIFQIGCAVGQPFILNSFTKLSANWFPEEEQALATGLGTMSLFVGLIIAMFLTPILYLSSTIPLQGINIVLIVYGIIALVTMILYLVFVKDKPESPPSPLASEEKTLMVQGMKDLFKNRDFIILFVAFLIGLGAFNAISAEIDLIFGIYRPMDVYSALTSGIMGGLMILGGIFGSVVLSALSDKYKNRKIFLILSLGVATALTPFIAYLPYLVPLYIICFVFGFFLMAALPIGLTYATEKTQPVPEGTSNGLLMLIGQIGGIILILTFSMVFIAILFGIGFILALFITEVQK